MPRQPRFAFPGAIFHVTDRGNRRATIFLCDRDRRLFLKRLGEVCLEHSWKCLSYCLMDNHYHLILRIAETGLSAGMQKLNARYAEHFNLAYDKVGHVFQGRFHDDLIDSDAYLLEAIRYVELNPVRAGLCLQADEWGWNSYAAVMGHRKHAEWFDRSRVLALFSPDPRWAALRFAEFVRKASTWKPPRMSAAQTARTERDRAILAAHAKRTHSIRDLARTFGISVGTVARVLKRSTLGSDPNVER